MAHYKYIRKLGNGTHGSVKLFRNNITGRLVPPFFYISPSLISSQVAIKKMRREFQSWEDCMKLNEVRVSAPLSMCGHLLKTLT